MRPRTSSCCPKSPELAKLISFRHHSSLTRDPGEFNGVSRGARVVTWRHRDLAACKVRHACVPTWASAVIPASPSPTSEIARPMSRSSHNVSPRQGIAATPTSCPNRNARLLSCPARKQGQSLLKTFPRFEILPPTRRAFRPRDERLRLWASRASPRHLAGTRWSLPSSQTGRRAAKRPQSAAPFGDDHQRRMDKLGCNTPMTQKLNSRLHALISALLPSSVLALRGM